MNTNIITANTVRKPTKICVPLAEAMNWRGESHQITRKLDGEFHVYNIELGGLSAVLATERMKYKANGFFTPSDRANFAKFGIYCVAFDVLKVGCLDMRDMPLRARWAQLAALAPHFDDQSGLVLVESGFGGDFVAAAMAAGAEGCCAKSWASQWGEPMTAAKRLQTFYCVVTSLPVGKQSVRIALAVGDDYARGEDCGSIALRGLKCDRVRIGSILKVNCMDITPAGMLREARLDDDSEISWLKRY